MVSEIDGAVRGARRSRARPAPPVLLALSDGLASVLAFAVATMLLVLAIVWLQPERVPPRVGVLAADRLAHFAVFIPLLLTWFAYMGHYKRGLPFWTEVKQIGGTVVFAALLDGFSQLLWHQFYSRPWLVLTWALAFVLIVAGRYAAKSAMLRLGVWQLPTIVVGSGTAAEDAVAALQSERLLGYQVIGRYEVGGGAPNVPSVRELLRGRGRRFIVIAVEAVHLARVERLIADLHRHGVPFAIVPPLSGISVLNLQARGFYSHDAVLLTAPNNLARLHARVIKRSFDLAVSATLLVLLSPLFLALGLLIRRDGGPVFYGQRRVGRAGRPILCLKFRTMVVDAEARLQALLANDPAARAEWARDHKLRDDPRVTPVGRFLRRTSLDELPQLLNVLRGEMSLVGPRPIVAAEIEKFGEDIVYYYEVDPGMTGLWQVSGRNNMDYRRRVQLNSWYVRNWSLWHDVTILIKTVRVVLARDGAY